MSMRRPRLTEHSAGPPLRNAQLVLHMHHGGASPETGSEVSRGHLCEDHVVERLVRHQRLQPRLLPLELLEPFRLVEA